MFFKWDPSWWFFNSLFEERFTLSGRAEVAGGWSAQQTRQKKFRHARGLCYLTPLMGRNAPWAEDERSSKQHLLQAGRGLAKPHGEAGLFSAWGGGLGTPFGIFPQFTSFLSIERYFYSTSLFAIATGARFAACFTGSQTKSIIDFLVLWGYRRCVSVLSLLLELRKPF